jgi:hypothetical protein
MSAGRSAVIAIIKSVSVAFGTFFGLLARDHTSQTPEEMAVKGYKASYPAWSKDGLMNRPE